MSQLDKQNESVKQDVKFLSASKSADFWKDMFIQAMRRIEKAKKIASHPPADKAILKALTEEQSNDQ